jgi:putative DNA primase/helicase
MSAALQSVETHVGGEPSDAELDAQVPYYDTRRLLDQLGELSPAEYGQRREQIAAELGTAIVFLDAEWKERRKRGAAPIAAGDIFGPIDPWPASVAGASLLRAIVRRMKRHIIFNDEAATAVALWIAFAWTHDAATHSPLLLVTSAEMNSGKTTLLGLISFLVPRSLSTVEVSSAVLYRAIEKWSPTLIVDEADVIFKQNPELRAVVNSGWTRGSGVLRCHPETHEPEIFSTFGPKAIGMKGKNLPDTTLGRSIVIEMRRKKSDERTDNFEHVDDDELITTRRLLARWAADNAKALIAARPVLPEGFQNRLAANWRPLLAIADVAGGEWPELARKVAKTLSNMEAESEGTALLSDIKSIFATKAVDRLASADLVAALHALEERPWAEFGRGEKPISPNQLARLLKAFVIVPGTIRTSAGTPKGYKLETFQDAFERYLPPVGTSETPQRHNGHDMGTSGRFQTATPEPHVAVQKCGKSLSDRSCGVVADELADHDAFEERAAILEFNDGLTREKAEAQARAELNQVARASGSRHPENRADAGQ